MTQPQAPKNQDPQDPDSLSLEPSRSAGTGSGKSEASRPEASRPDFSNIRSSTDSVARGGSGASGGPGGRPDFSNVKSSASTVPGDTTPTATRQTYTVQAGDTLSHIAQRHYGKASRWRAIFEANRDQLDNPDLIHPGQVLKIPPQDPTDDA